MGRAAEEVCGGAGPYVVAKLLGSGLSFPVRQPNPFKIAYVLYFLSFVQYFRRYIYNLLGFPSHLLQIYK